MAVFPKENFYCSGVSAWMGHAPFAYWLVSALRPKTIVELGSHWGDSYFAMCQSVAENKTGSKCFAVDTWQGDKHAGFYDETVFQAVASRNNEKYSNFSTLLRSDFSEAANHFDDSSIDLLHIDGLHTYESVKHDFETWLPKLAPDAVVMLHDTHEKRADFGVYKLWDELMSSFSNYLDFSHSHGLGVICFSSKTDLKKLTAGHWGPNWKEIIEGSGFLSRGMSLAKGEHISELTAMNSSVASGVEQLARSKSELDRLKSELDRAVSENEILAHNNDVVGIQLGIITSESDRLKSELDRAVSENEILAHANAVAAQELEQLIQRVEKSNLLAVQILESKSWKLTAPLRTLGTALGLGR